jgi:PKD repeat protein
LGPDNARGERAVAVEKGLGEFNCAWSPPIAAFDIDCPSAGTGHCFDLTDQSSNAIPGTTYTWYFPGGTPSTSTDPNPIVCYTSPGQYDVAMVVDNGVGIDSIYSTNAVYVATTPGLPYFEGFENYANFLNIDQWSTYNPGGNQSFLINSNAALSGTKSAILYNYSQSGNFEDELISGPVDLSTLLSTDDMTLTFRYSYRKKVASNDEWLKVFVTKSCEDTWVQRKTIHGDALSPLTSSSAWVPSTDADWTTVHMTNVTSSYFVGDFRFKFEFESDGGNNFYLDNINLYQGAPSDDIVSGVGLAEMEISNASLYPNPTDGELNVEFDLNNAQATELTILDLTGKQLNSYSVSGQSGKNSAFIDVNTLASGVYFLKINVEGISHQMRFIIQ